MKHTETNINSDTAWRDGFSAALQWICTGGPDPTNISQVESFDKKVINAIHATIREDFGRNPKEIYLNTRKHELVMLRVFSWEAYQMCTGASMEQTMLAFGGLRKHSTFAAAKRNIIGSLDYSPAAKRDFHRFLYGVQARLDNATKDDRARYVDLGLPSGVLWSDRNIIGFHDDSLLGTTSMLDQIPLRNDFEELIKECEYKWSDELSGLFFIGKNGNSVFFPANGAVTSNGNRSKNIIGQYLINKEADETENIFKFHQSISMSFSFVRKTFKQMYVSVRTVSRL